MSSSESRLPYGTISGKKLVMQFSAYDIDLPVLAAGLRERLDVLHELDVAFAGFGTEVPASVSDQTPVMVKCFFEYVGKDSDAAVVLKKAYHVVWSGMIDAFPEMAEWATAKADLSELTAAQAEMLRARKGQ